MELTVFDQVLYQFETVATGGIPQVRALVMATFWLLATIDACMAFLMNLEDGNQFKILIQKCLKIGFWLFMVNEWGTFCDAILNGFIQVGAVVGSGASLGLMQHPSQLVGQGLVTLKPILDYESTLASGWTEVIGNLPVLLAGICAYLIGCLAYIILAIQVVLTYVEFCLVCVLFTLFIPFGVTKWTSFLAEKAIGGIIAYGVKLMVLSCIVSIVPDVLNSYTITELTDANALTWMISLVAVALLLAFLAWSAPGLAASVMTGGPSLTAGGVAGATAGAAIGTAAVLAGGSKAASALGAKLTGSGGGDTKGHSSNATAAASDVSGGTPPTGSTTGSESSTGGSNASPQFSQDGAASYAGDATPAVGNGDSGKNYQGTTSNISNTTTGNSEAGTKNAPHTGADVGSSAPNSSSGTQSRASVTHTDGQTPATTSSAGQKTSASAPNFASSALSGAMLAKNAIPSEASPHGSLHAPIRD